MSNLQDILIDEGITITELSRESGVSTTTISRIINGKSVGKPTTQSKVAKGINSLAGNDKYTREGIFNIRVTEEH